jgi:hypothetical protein
MTRKLWDGEMDKKIYQVAGGEPREVYGSVGAASHEDAAKKYLECLLMEGELEEGSFPLWVQEWVPDAPWVEVEAGAWMRWHFEAREVNR